MVWWFLVIFIVALVLAVKSIPKTEARKPAGFDEVTMPTTTEGQELGVLFGTRKVRGVFIHWWGDYQTLAIMKKAGK